ncbi:TonB-dependent receptor [Flavivirga aquatica]|uniref:TonB-dependent receptor n=1 Tax=Flavivirga aquatica TaxID=1849968 RepID=A0A1E5SIN2_9FLAO|nr:TonB-dependent receptor [Flavivirga aquatica]OEJ98973.1 TonB-dependent receptor [Flavivirga aquatica]
MRKHIKNIFIVILLLSVTIGFSQRKENDTLNTGVIDVVKPYAPTVSDAFKVKEVPHLNDETTQVKKEVKYNIFSFPVASTFTPAKGKAEVIEKKPLPNLYNNYATLGVGSYKTLLGEVYFNHPISRNENIGGYISNHSSLGDIEDVLVDSRFSDTKIELNYGTRLRDLSWNVEAGFQYQIYNWYGLPENYANDKIFTYGLDVGHSFLDAHFGADVAFEDTYINSGSFFFRRFGDNQGSGENRLIIKGKVDVPIRDIEISTGVKIDYIAGDFDKDYFTDEELKYGNFQIGISPTYQMKQDDLTVNIGVSTYYLSDTEASESKLYIYPNVTATYRMVEDVLIAYGGIEGDLIQNSYYGFAGENPFVSPTLFISPTDQLYNAYVGLKGKLSSNTSYNVSGHYISDRNKALFRNNFTSLAVVDVEDYKYGNSFGIVYDNVDTFSFSGEITVDLNRNFKLGMKAEYFGYSTDDEAEAWNLPDIKGSVFLDYQINDHWFAGANLFLVGGRKDLLSVDDNIFGATSMVVDLDSYFDANAHLGYHINDEFSVFAKANNIASQGYQRWQNFQVQSFQLIAGATYKFDF